MRVLFLSMPMGKGHINPLIGVIQELKRRGHEVAYLALPMSLGVHESQVRNAGAEVLPTPSLETPTVSEEEMPSVFADPARIAQYLKVITLDVVPHLLEPTRAIIRELRPDVIAADSMLCTAFVAAHLEKVPCASIFFGLRPLVPSTFENAHIRGTVALLDKARAELFAACGTTVKSRLNDYVSSTLNIVFATEALVGARVEMPPHTHLVGPSLPRSARGDEPDFPWDRLRSDLPLVYVSTGSLLRDHELMEILSEAFARLPIQVVMSSVGDVGRVKNLAKNVIAVPYAPQLAILERTSVFVTHGGANSVMEAMHAGVPLLVIPLSTDQPVQAHFVREAGVGLTLDRASVTADACEEALTRLLEPGCAYRANALSIRSSYRANDGARRAAELLVQLGERRQAVGGGRQ